MDQQRTLLMVGFVLAIVVLVGGVIYQQTRINTLEEELASRPAMGDMIVVGTGFNAPGTSAAEFCVRYQAFGSVETNCIPVIIEQKALPCMNEAKVGRPFPTSCR